MTPSVDSLLESIEKLSAQVDDLTIQVTDLSSGSRDLFKTVQLNKEYTDELNTLTNVSKTQPRKLLITALQDEVKVVHQLESENCELKTAIQNHREVLNLILNKYKDQKQELQRIEQFESKNMSNTHDLVQLRHEFLQRHLTELVRTMNQAFRFDEAKILQQERLVKVLKQENNKIKRLLQPNLPQ